MDRGSFCRVCSRELSAAEVSGIRDWEYGFPGEFAYRPCPGCGVRQLYPFPDLDDLREAYRIDYHGHAEPGQKGLIYSLLFRTLERMEQTRLRQLVAGGASVLDVGCGIGLFLEKLRALGAANLAGIDFNEHAVQSVRAKGIACHQGTFLDFPAEPASFDVVVMSNYLEHTLNPGQELAQARRLLRPNGVLLGEMPNFRSIDRAIFGRYWGGNHVPRHTFQFTPSVVKSFLNQAGFSRVRLVYPLNTSHFALSVQNLFQRNIQDLRHNNALKHGRAKYYSTLLLALIPFNLLAILIKRTGFIRFEARP